MEESDEYWNQGDIVTYLKLTGQSTTLMINLEKCHHQCYPKPTEDDYAIRGHLQDILAVKGK